MTVVAGRGGWLLCLSLSCSIAACERAEGPPAVVDEAATGVPVGAYCTIQFKRDVLGASGDLPVSPTADSIHGASLSIRGSLVTMNRDWVVIKQEDVAVAEVWVPRANVLLLSIRRQGG
ncbi:MAG: hypothetical protein AAGA57_04005 [Planctomycetota bacterium]